MWKIKRHRSFKSSAVYRLGTSYIGPVISPLKARLVVHSRRIVLILLALILSGLGQLFHNDYKPAATDPTQHEYWLSVGPITGSTAATYTYASFFNPLGSGKTMVAKRIRFNTEAVAAAVFQDVYISRTTAATGGTQIAAADIPKKNGESANSVAEVRHTSVTTTLVDTINNRALMAVVAAGAPGSPYAGKDYAFTSNEVVLQPGEGIAMHQTAAGDIDQRLRMAVEWQEVATAPAATDAFMMAYPRVSNAGAIDYKYQTLFNPAASGKTALVSRLSIDVDCSAAAVYTNPMYIRRISAASLGTAITASTIPEKHTGGASSVMDARHTTVTATFATGSTVDSSIAEVNPCGVANQPQGHLELTYGTTNEYLILKPGEGIALTSNVAGSTGQLVRLSAAWSEQLSTPASEGEYALAIGPVNGVANTVGYNYASVFNPVASGKTMIMRKVGIRVDNVAAAVYTPMTLKRINAALTGGTTIAPSAIPKKHTSSVDSIAQVQHTGMTAVSTVTDDRLLSVTSPGGLGQVIGHSMRGFETHKPIVLQPGQGIVLFQEAAGDVDFRVKLHVEWDEEVSAPAATDAYMMNLGPITGTATSGYNYFSFYNPSGSGKSVSFERLGLRIDAAAAAAYVPVTIQRISAVTAATGTAIAASLYPEKHTGGATSVMDIRTTAPTVTKTGGADARILSVTTPGAVASSTTTATTTQTSGYSELNFNDVETLVLQPGEGIVVYQEAVGSTGLRVRMHAEWVETVSAPASQGEYVISTGPVTGVATADYAYSTMHNPANSGKNYIIKRVEIRADRVGAGTYFPASVRRITAYTGGTSIAAADIPEKHSGTIVSSADIRTGLTTVTYAPTNAASRLMGVTIPGAVGEDSGLADASVISGDELILKPGEGIALHQEGAGDVNMRFRLRIVWSEEAAPLLTQAAYRWYENLDALTPTTALANQDTALTASNNAALRLRMGLDATGSTTYADSTSFKLQHATSTSGPWTDVAPKSPPTELITDPVSAPAGTAKSVAWSPNGTYLAVANTTSPFLTIYKRSGDTLTKIAAPAVTAITAANSVAWSPDSSRLAVGYDGSGYVDMYARSSDTFSRAGAGTFFPAPTSSVNAMAYHPVSAAQYTLALGQNNTPYLNVGKGGSSSWGSLSPSSSPASSVTGVAWSPDGSYMSVTHTASPFITTYSFNGTSFTKLSDPASLPGSAGRSTAWSPDGTYMSVTTDAAPYIVIYKRSGNTFTRLPNPNSLPTGTARGVAWSPDGYSMTVAHDTTPFVTTYHRSGDVFTKLPNPATLPDGNAHSVSYSTSGTYMTVGHETSPYLTTYRVPATSVWKYKENVTPANAATLDSALLTGSPVLQSYSETNPTIPNPTAMIAGQRGEWDFALDATGALASTTYYFRMVKSDGTALGTYSVYPQLTTQAAANTAPGSASSPAQMKTDNTTISTGGWNNSTGVKFTASATDPDAGDTLQLCVEADLIGTAFSGTEDSCGTGVAYSGATITPSVTLTLPTDPGEYHWQARIKDAGGLYSSSWTPYDVNLESARDFGVDTTAPTGGIVYDGTTNGTDASFNDNSLSALSANWTGFSTDLSGLEKYEYSIGTSAGAIDTKGWTNVGTDVSVTASSLALQTSKKYFINVRATDNAGNTRIVSSDGQFINPAVSFSISPSTITMANLNASNAFTDTKTTTLTTSTNAYGGYVVRGFISDLLRSANNKTIGNFSGGSYAAPDSWQPGDLGFGYTSSDSVVQGVNKFQATTCPGGSERTDQGCYAPFASSGPGDIVADDTANVTGTPITNQQFTVTYRATTANTQAATRYSTNIIYTITPIY